MRDIYHSMRSKNVPSPPDLPQEINPWQIQPPLPVPAGHTLTGILASLVTLSIDGSATGELRTYASSDVERFLRTLDLVPSVPGKLLEIGANPYFTTLLMREFRPEYALTLTNFFGGDEGSREQNLSYTGFDGKAKELVLEFFNVNIERSRLPFDDNCFDTVLFCEVLEHLTNDPLFALSEIHRVLAPQGSLILTTPNVARLENVIALLEGRNLYDPYSGYGAYGRHNREYTRHELHLLLTHSGFSPEVSYTANVHTDATSTAVALDGLSPLCRIPNRRHDLGQYLFMRWRKTRSCDSRLPSWLYRSYPQERMG